MKSISIELSEYNEANNLWTDLIEYFGCEKAKKMISQASDLQKMSGKKNVTMPILFIGTGGLALIEIDKIAKVPFLKKTPNNQILIFNPKKKLFQLLKET